MIVLAFYGWIIWEVMFPRVLYNFKDKDHTSETVWSTDMDRFTRGEHAVMTLSLPHEQ